MDAKLENSNAKIDDCCTKMDKANLVMGSKILGTLPMIKFFHKNSYSIS